MPQIDPTQLRTALSKLFSTGELRTLCFDLGIEYEDLEGAGKSGKALALVQYGQRHGRYNELVYRVQQLRPHANLGTAVAPPENMPQQDSKPVTNIYVGGDYVGGDKVKGDKVSGDKTSVGDISGSSGIAIGRGASSTVNTGPTYNISGPVTGSVIGGGEVHAENIAGGDIHINAEPKNKDAFNQQLLELKALLEKALADGDFTNTDDAQDAADDLEKALREAQKDTPRTEQLKSRLESVSGLIEAGAKAGTAVLKATPIIAGLIKAASIIF